MLIELLGLHVLGGICWFTYKVYIWPYYLSPLRKLPGPPSENLFYGNLKRFLVEEPSEIYLGWVKQYGDFIKIHGLFNKPVIVVTDAKILQEILLNQSYDFSKPLKVMSDTKAILGEGLALAEGEAHKRQRKMMNPAFAHNNIKNMIPSFVRVSLTLKGLIEDKVNNGESKIILSPHISNATLDVIGLVGFKHEFNSLTSPNELAKAYEFLMDNKSPSILFMVIASYIPAIRKIPIPVNKRFHNICKVINRESEKLMKEKYDDDKNNKLDGNDLISLLINLNKTLPFEEKMTDEELKHQIMTFLLAGHITTSMATSWALYQLATHSHEQDLLREELVNAFPDKSKFNPTFDEINSLEYLNCVVKETLRLNPPAMGVRRYNTKDKIIGEHFIPKNTHVIIPIAALQRLPSVWGPTADKFEPKRWLDPSLVNNVTNFNYLPFLTGTRSCIGNKLALNEFKILLSMLVRNFVFRPVEGLHITSKFGKLEPYLELNVSKVEA